MTGSSARSAVRLARRGGVGGGPRLKRRLPRPPVRRRGRSCQPPGTGAQGWAAGSAGVAAAASCAPAGGGGGGETRRFPTPPPRGAAAATEPLGLIQVRRGRRGRRGCLSCCLSCCCPRRRRSRGRGPHPTPPQRGGGQNEAGRALRHPALRALAPPPAPRGPSPLGGLRRRSGLPWLLRGWLRSPRAVRAACPRRLFSQVCGLSLAAYLALLGQTYRLPPRELFIHPYPSGSISRLKCYLASPLSLRNKVRTH